MASSKQKLFQHNILAFLAGFFLVAGTALGAVSFLKTSVLDAAPDEEQTVVEEEVEFVPDTSSEEALRDQLKEYQEIVQKNSGELGNLSALARDLKKFSEKDCTKSTCGRAVKALEAASKLGVIDLRDVKDLKSDLKSIGKKAALSEFNDDLSSLASGALSSLDEKLAAKKAESLRAKDAVTRIQKALSELAPKKIIKQKIKKVSKPVKTEEKLKVKKVENQDDDVKVRAKKSFKDDNDEEKVKKSEPKKTLKDDDRPVMRKVAPKQPVQEEDDDSEFFDDSGADDTSDSDAEDAGEEFTF
jgi:hypothetical protein